jgi:short subunit fatty acids transporter
VLITILVFFFVHQAAVRPEGLPYTTLAEWAILAFESLVAIVIVICPHAVAFASDLQAPLARVAVLPKAEAFALLLSVAINCAKFESPVRPLNLPDA